MSDTTPQLACSSCNVMLKKKKKEKKPFVLVLSTTEPGIANNTAQYLFLCA